MARVSLASVLRSLAFGACLVAFLPLLSPGLAPAAPAARSAPRVELMVVGKTRVLYPAHEVPALSTTVSVGRRRCGVASATPLATLAAGRRRGAPSFRLRDYAACSRSPANSGQLFVTQIGRDRNRGRAGWVYKVDRRLGTTGAADTSGAFGTGRRLRSGQRILWFYCGDASSCQRTLEATPSSRQVSSGATVAVTVRGYDDQGRAKRIAGASVRLGSARALTGSDGVARLAAPNRSGRYGITATAAGLVPSFSEAVRVR